jgi:hypothetical protein
MRKSINKDKGLAWRLIKVKRRLNQNLKVTLIYKGILREKMKKEGSRRREAGSRESHRRRDDEGGGMRWRCSKGLCSSNWFFQFRFPEFCSIVRRGEMTFSVNSTKYPILFFHTLNSPNNTYIKTLNHFQYKSFVF